LVGRCTKRERVCKMRYRYLKGYKYELIDTEAVNTAITGLEIDTEYIALWITSRFFVKQRYAWDGPSFLTIDTKNSMRGSLIHDALYQLMREGKLDRKWRKCADELLRDICIEDGMWSLRAKTWYWFVRKFAGKSSMARKNPRGKIITWFRQKG